MPVEVTINSITGLSPYDIYLCNDPISTCIYIDTITSGDTPYTFQVPIPFSNEIVFNLKIVDDNDCVIIQNLNI
jgi:hypothetical protein